MHLLHQFTLELNENKAIEESQFYSVLASIENIVREKDVVEHYIFPDSSDSSKRRFSVYGYFYRDEVFEAEKNFDILLNSGAMSLEQLMELLSAHSAHELNAQLLNNEISEQNKSVLRELKEAYFTLSRNKVDINLIKTEVLNILKSLKK